MNAVRCVSFAVWLWSLCAATATAAASSSAAYPPEGKVCGSMDLRNLPQNLLQLENCTVVDGSLRIVLLDKLKASDYPQFPLLREITQYLMVYRVVGLESVGHMFPNLALIRGARSKDHLYTGSLSLMIHDNEDLKEIGLYSLTNITQGSVLISKNPSEYILCVPILNITLL